MCFKKDDIDTISASSKSLDIKGFLLYLCETSVEKVDVFYLVYTLYSLFNIFCNL